MIWLQLSLAGARAILVAAVAYLAVTQFLGSAAAATVRDLWEQYLGGLPLGPLAGYLVVHASLLLSLALLAAPVMSALLGQGSRAIVWLVIAAYVLLAPAVLATSWIDWFRFLGDEAASRLDAPASEASSLVAVVAATVALLLLWQTDRLQTAVARLRILRVPAHDVYRHAVGYTGTTFAMAAGALALGGIAYGIARIVMAATGELDPRSWVSIGAVVAGLFATGATVTALVAAHSRQPSSSNTPTTSPGA